jgi:Na+/phosphate symporter
MGRTWRPSEDKVLRNTVEEFFQRGEDKELAFKQAAELLNRTERACSDRWRILYRKRRINARVMNQVVLPAPHEEQMKMFESFMQSYEFIKNQHGALLEENERLRSEVDRLKTKLSQFLEMLREDD